MNFRCVLYQGFFFAVKSSEINADKRYSFLTYQDKNCFYVQLLYLSVTFMEGLCPFSRTSSSKFSSAFTFQGYDEKPTYVSFFFFFLTAAHKLSAVSRQVNF